VLIAMLQTPTSREVLKGPMWVSKVRSEDEAGVIVVLTSGHVFVQSLVTLDGCHFISENEANRDKDGS
jgi:hypothetical protein